MTQRLSIVLPVYNEESCIAELLSLIEKHISQKIEFVIVDDGSTDRTSQKVKSIKLRPGNSKKLLELSRNFGHQQAIFAGLEHVSNDSSAIVVMDSDLQDRPADIPLLLSELSADVDCVYAIRTPRSSTALIDLLTRFFYKLQTVLSSFPIPRFAGTFCVFSKPFLENILLMKEIDVYFPGLRAYVGMNQKGVVVERDQRKNGRSRVGILGLMRLSITGLFGFSAIPMRAILIGGVAMTGLCMVGGFSVILLRFVGVLQVSEITLLIVLLFGLFGVQMIFVGVVGEYLGKVFIESKRRPRSIVKAITDE